MEGGPCGRAKGFGCEGVGGAALSGGRCCGCGSAKCRRGSDDCAYVAGILQAGKNHDQRSGTVGGWTGDVVEGESTRRYESGDALRMFGVSDAFEETVGRLQDWNSDFRAVEILSKARAMAFARFAEENGANRRG